MAKFCSPFLDQNGSKTSQAMLSAKLNLNFSFLFKSLVRSSLEYADVVWDGCSESESNLLESLQIEGGYGFFLELYIIIIADYYF